MFETIYPVGYWEGSVFVVQYIVLHYSRAVGVCLSKEGDGRKWGAYAAVYGLEFKFWEQVWPGE